MIPAVRSHAGVDSSLRPTKVATPCRNRNGINARSKLEIACADHDLYFARIDDKVALKLGPRYDIGDLAPQEQEGWKLAASGPDYAIWEKN